MKAGKLRHRVTLQTPVKVKDTSYGSETVTWSDFATVWASFTVRKANENFQSQQEKSEVIADMTMRYRAGVNSTMRAVYNGQAFEILSVIDTDERHVELALTCRKWS